LRILIGHNRYKSAGGEDAVVKAEKLLLEDYGHEVIEYQRSNEELEGLNLPQKASYLKNLSWSKRTFNEITQLIKDFRPDIAHFHNIFFMISPSAYYACKELDVTVIQSQHNFRLLCANALFYRDNHICEDCTSKNLWQGVKNKCYQNSRFLSFLTVFMLNEHWRKRTWIDQVDGYITATEFTRQKYIQGGIPEDKMYVKPNLFLADPGKIDNQREYALYVGRLSHEKGVEYLIDVWESVPKRPLKIIGDGPLMTKLRKRVEEKNMNHVEILGFVDSKELDQYMQKGCIIFHGHTK